MLVHLHLGEHVEQVRIAGARLDAGDGRDELLGTTPEVDRFEQRIRQTVENAVVGVVQVAVVQRVRVHRLEDAKSLQQLNKLWNSRLLCFKVSIPT